MVSVEIEKFARLIVENDLLFKIAENWETVPIYVNDGFRIRQRTLAIGNNLEDYQSLTSHLKRCLSVYYDDDCTANLDAITQLLDKYREVIGKVIYDPNPDREVFVATSSNKYRTKIKGVLSWLMLMIEVSPNKEIKIKEIDNE